MTLLDIAMMILFLIFMVFIFGGYHKTKSAHREADEKKAKNMDDSF
ncbi:hypothetical protein [Sulfurimonas sp.]|nr:hypothetical protein [Sulfurimonas sp.]MBW6487618.1 hypothetical protein [Sulfurimonas sp.]